jgi:hypothetical protein
MGKLGYGEQEHNIIPNHQHDKNISLNIEDMIARVYVREYSFPGGEHQVEVFSSSNWEKAEERYLEALMLRDQSGFKDAASIQIQLELIEAQYEK